MENEILQQTRKHFSKLGLAYFFGSLIIIGLQNIADYIIHSMNPGMQESNYTLYFVIMMLSMYLISMPLMGLIISKMQSGEALQKRKMSLGEWIIAFLICYGGVYVGNIVGNIFTQIIGILKGRAVTNELNLILMDLNPVAAFFIMVICAPIAEELLFRKLLIERTIRYGEGVSILFSGLLFGLFHGNLNQFTYAFLLGCFFGFIFVKTGNIRYTITMHMLINFLGSIVSMQILRLTGMADFLEAYTAPDADIVALTMQYISGIGVFLLYTLVILGITIAGIILFVVKFRRFTLTSTELSAPKGMRFRTYLLNLGMILFGILWIAQIIIQLFQ